MKPALISFAVTAALLSLNVLPGAWTVAAGAQAAADEDRHARENKDEVAARLGITKI